MASRLDPLWSYMPESALPVLHARIHRWARSIGFAAAVGLAYYLAAWLSFGFRISFQNVIYWPAAGISAGVLISLWSVARWPVIVGMMVATLVFNLMEGYSLAATLMWIVGNTAEPLIVATLVHRYSGANFTLDRLYPVLGLFAAAVVGTIASATWWTFTYYFVFASLSQPVIAWLEWFMSDLAGIVSVAPVVIALATVLHRPLRQREAFEGIIALAVLGLATAMIVSIPKLAWETVVPSALLFPALLLLAARCPPIFAATGAFIVSITIACAAIFGVGHFGETGLSINSRVLQTQSIILFIAPTACILAALFAERRDNEARLARSNMLLQGERDNKLMNLEAIGASIAHEMKQPLAAISANGGAALALLEKRRPDVQELSEALNDIVLDSHRASNAIDAIRSLFRTVDQNHQQINLNEMTIEVLQSLHSEFKEYGISAIQDLTAEIPPINGNRSQLQQVILNLVHNAVEAMGATTNRSRVLRISTKQHSTDTVAVMIQDSGPGIEPKLLDGLFEAFITTKPGGMGLGLAISRMIVERHGGQLIAASNGQGALFEAVFPIKS